MLAGDSPGEPKEHVEQKKEAIKEGVLTCLNLLRATIRENNQIAPSNEPKKKTIILKKKKNLDILHANSDEDDDNEEKENEPTTPQLDENGVRRKTVRGSNSSKRSVSIKTPDEESPSKRTKKTSDVDVPLPVISPMVAKKVTLGRKKSNTDGEEKKSKSLRLTKKTQLATEELKAVQTEKTSKKEAQEKPVSSGKKASLPSKSSADVRNDKGESAMHQAVKKGDIKRVQQLIDQGHSVNTIDNNSWTPLHEVQLSISTPLFSSHVLLCHRLVLRAIFR